MGTHIDINADLGEGLNNEAQLFPLISSCNIACGGHAGDTDTMAAVVKLARQYRVKVGAHPSFPDIANFGRTVMDMSSADLYTSLKHQIRALMKVLRTEHMNLHHVKPHGALYNLAAVDGRTAAVIAEVIKSIALPLRLYCPYRSAMAEVAKINGIEVVYEAFADRNYNDDGSLVSRQQPDAMITNTSKMVQHVLTMIEDEKVIAINGVGIPIKVDTICVHGDTENAVELIQYLVRQLTKKGILIR